MINIPQPPKWVDALIDRLAPAELAEEIRGDLYEMFLQDISISGFAIAKRKYIVNGLGFLAKRFFWKSSHYSSTPLFMNSSYFKVAWRSLMAYKSNSLINILGLVIGIASTLVIISVIHFELSFDSFHTNADRIYRMVRVSGDNMDEFRSGISYPVPNALREEIPALKNSVATEYFGGAIVEVLDDKGTIEKTFQEQSGLAIVEPSFFDVFDFKETGFKWLSGNPDNALTEPNTVVITKSIAKKYFGDEPALGKTIKFGKEIDCKITGVIEDLPLNSDLPFTVLISYSTLRKKTDERMNEWSSVSDDHHTYLVLEEGITQKEMEEKIAAVHARHTPKSLHESRHYLLQPLSELHNDARFGNYSGRTISKETILALSLVALFLLLTASINYINLSTAQSTLRAKEIGLRKVMGSSQRSLIIQFITETFILVVIAGVIALAASEFLMIRFQSLLNMKWTHYHFTNPFFLVALLLIIAFVTLFSGFYPSLMISRFNPVSSLKNKFSTEQVGGFSLRKILVVFQFTITQILVVGTFIVVSQMKFFNERDMGFNKEAIFNAPIPDNNPSKIKVLEDQLRAQSFVSNVSFSFTLPSGAYRYHNYQSIAKREATSDKEYVGFEYASVDPSFIDLYQIRLLAGRNLTIQDTVGNILINKALMKSLQLGTPEEAIGVGLKMGRNVTVVGVIDDYYSNSLKQSVNPIVMLINPDSFHALSIKLNINDQQSIAETVTHIEKIWKATFPEHIFEYQFFDENIRDFYKQEEKYATLFQLFSFVFLLIGCLGLYGLITFLVNRKEKEMAIRKVLGASISQILLLFSREYVQLILISFVLAVPITYYAINSWLSNFAEQIPLQWWLFMIPGFSVLAIALLVVIIKSMGTANANPVEKLKYE